MHPILQGGEIWFGKEATYMIMKRRLPVLTAAILAFLAFSF
jgi:hypothetical protein